MFQTVCWAGHVERKDANDWVELVKHLKKCKADWYCQKSDQRTHEVLGKDLDSNRLDSQVAQPFISTGCHQVQRAEPCNYDTFQNDMKIATVY